MLSLLCGHYCGRSDSVPSQETPWLCYCHDCGHSKSLQHSEINTSWPAACSHSPDGDSWLIRGDIPVTCPSKAWVSWLGRDINECHSAWSALSITADFGLDKWNKPQQGDFHRAPARPLSKNINTSIHDWTLYIYYPDTLKCSFTNTLSSLCRICSVVTELANNW